MSALKGETSSRRSFFSGALDLLMQLVPKKWADFQHYKDRCPPWIKLHRDILNDKEYMRLPLASKALAPLLWLLASESKDGVFDATTDELEFRLRLTKQEVESGLRPLIDKGFFVIASGVLAECLPTAIPEESRGETEKRKSRVETARGSRLPTNFYVDMQFAVDQGLTNCLEEAHKFRDYWNAQPGQKGVKLDWPATWRNWCRNAKKPLPAYQQIQAMTVSSNAAEITKRNLDDTFKNTGPPPAHIRDAIRKALKR